MSVRKGQSHTPRTTAAPDYGVIDPDTFWDRVLPYPAAAEAEVDSLLIRRQTGKLPVPPSRDYVTPVASGWDSTAAEVR